MTPSPAPAAAAQLGQLFMAGIPGQTLDDSTRRLIREFGVNNFIYFRRNVAGPEQLRQLSQDLRSACREAGLEPPLIAIDQEGGTVARLPPPFTQFADARLLAAAAEPERALLEYARVCSRELRSVGVNYNLAPVLDVCEAGQDLFMERRSIGSDPQEVARLGSLVIGEMQGRGIAACGKHFPGLGAAVVDPHVELPVVARNGEDIRRIDLVPFRQAIAAGVASIMTSHTIYLELDPEQPATLSEKILTGLLRRELGYRGVIITDDLEMGAIEKGGDASLAALQAFESGADLLLICHSHDKAIAALHKTAAGVEQNQELQARLAESLERVGQLRQSYAGNE